MNISEYITQLLVLSYLTILSWFKPELEQRAKRMLFLTSVAHALERNHIVTHETAQSVNLLFNISKTEDSLSLGKELSPIIWADQKIKAIADDDNETVCARLITSTPKWLKYDTHLMQTDLFKFINNSKQRKSISA